MKKLLLVAMAILTFMFAFCGCDDNKNEEITGKWIPTTAVINGETVPYSSLELDKDSFEIEFFKDGKCTITSFGVTEKGSYIFNDTSVDVTINNSSQKLDYATGTISYTLNYHENPMSVNFVRTNE